MIPVQGFTGARVAVLGLGRSGLATARALRAGGAVAICWDDDENGRTVAQEQGYEIADLARIDWNPRDSCGHNHWMRVGI